jgi:hypothetical protein
VSFSPDDPDLPRSPGVPDEETDSKRWQRNFNELLQELRVAQTGVQILFAFLLTLAISNRLEDADGFTQVTYLIALLAAAAATAVLIAPVAYHRALFRRGRKPSIVRSAHRMASVGLGLLLVAMVASVLLAVDLVVGRALAVPVAGAVCALFVYLWGVAPWMQRDEPVDDPDEERVDPAPDARARRSGTRAETTSEVGTGVESEG